MLNPYFNFQSAHNEQDLVEDLVIESIQIYGMDITYLPKTLIDYDALLGEDPQRAFENSYVIEAYFENVDGFMGDKNFLNKMGLNIDKEATFVLSKRRFDEVLLNLAWKEDWSTTTTYSINDAVHYNGIIYVSAVDNNLNAIPGTNANWSVVQQVRPKEGDLIYLPLTHDIFEIMMADHEEIFYQLGKIYVWKLSCEKYRFSHETIDTGIAEIDQIAADLANDDSLDNDPLSDNETIEQRMNKFINTDPNSPF